MSKEIANKEKIAERKAEALKTQLAKAQSALESLQHQSGYVNSIMGGAQSAPG